MEWMEQSLEMMKSWTDMQKRMSQGWLDAAAGLGKAEDNPLAEWVARWQETAQKSMDAWEELTRKFAENEGQVGGQRSLGRAHAQDDEDAGGLVPGLAEDDQGRRRQAVGLGQEASGTAGGRASHPEGLERRPRCD